VNSLNAIEVRDLVKSFPRRGTWRSLYERQGETLVLDHVSLEIEAGTIFGLLGPNGAGKTTLIKILCGLLLPTAGRVSVDGLDVVKNSREVRQRIGVVYGDERSFYWRLSVAENLRFYAALYGIHGRAAQERIADVLSLVGLSESANEAMQSFSTGMRQRAAIARGLLNDPRILFMDEPTRTLDPLGARELRQFVRERVAEAGRTVLLATNVMAEAEELCDRVAILYRGNLQLMGTLEELRQVLQPEDVYAVVVGNVQAGAVAEIAAGVEGIRSVETAEGSSPGTLRLRVITVADTPALPSFIRRLVGQSADIWSCTRNELSLEEMFSMATIGRDGAGKDQPGGTEAGGQDGRAREVAEPSAVRAGQ
jgi:ABC-2 type transport system ATP-binding protein